MQRHIRVPPPYSHGSLDSPKQKNCPVPIVWITRTNITRHKLSVFGARCYRRMQKINFLSPSGPSIYAAPFQRTTADDQSRPTKKASPATAIHRLGPSGVESSRSNNPLILALNLERSELTGSRRSFLTRYRNSRASGKSSRYIKNMR